MACLGWTTPTHRAAFATMGLTRIRHSAAQSALASSGLVEPCSCAGNPRRGAPPSRLAQYEAQLRALVSRVLTDLRGIACAIAKATLRDAMQAFLDGLLFECPECLPFIFPLATALYAAALAELQSVCPVA